MFAGQVISLHDFEGFFILSLSPRSTQKACADQHRIFFLKEGKRMKRGKKADALG
jgi:hypothetical protein